MPYEQEWSAVRQSLDKVTVPWKKIQQRLPAVPERWSGLVAVTGLAVCTFALRCLHLAQSNHYYLISPDSYYFHWLSNRVVTGLEIPSTTNLGEAFPLHSGLTYPLTYLSKIFSGVFGLSSADALNLSCKLLPPIVGILSLLIIYIFVSRVCDRRTALFSAFSWVAIQFAVVIGAAGYVDRDGLSVFLLISGAVLFYCTKYIHIRIGNRDIGWLLAGLGVLIIEGLLFLEWSFVGPVLLLAVILTYFVIKAIVIYQRSLQIETGVWRRIKSAVFEANGLTFAVLIVGNVSVLAANTELFTSIFELGRSAVQVSGKSFIMEMQGLTLGHILGFSLFLVPIILGLYRAVRTRNDFHIFISAWFLSLLILSLFANRVLYYAIPAACLLSGVGLALLWEKMKQGDYIGLKQAGVGVLLTLLIAHSIYLAFFLASSPFAAMNEDWQDAMAYMRDDTPADAVVISQWSVGYWILDQGQRRPVWDNGFYGWDFADLHEMGLLYASTEPEDIVKIMERHGADYLIFSEYDTLSTPTILGWAGLEDEYKGFESFPKHFLITRILNGEFESGGGLEVVYRSEPNSEVVILTAGSSELALVPNSYCPASD